MRISDWSSDVCSSDLPPSFPAEEQVRAHRSHLVQAAAPIRHDPVGMVMGGVSDGTEYSSRERCARNAACPFPCRLRWHAGQSAIAGKGELTTGNAFRSLEHHRSEEQTSEIQTLMSIS